MEALLVRCSCRCVYRPQESLICVYSKGVESPIKKVVGIVQKDYDMSVLYHPGKANVVADALNRMTMGSVSHVKKHKKDLVKDVHRLARLGVRFEDSLNGGFGPP